MIEMPMLFLYLFKNLKYLLKHLNIYIDKLLNKNKLKILMAVGSTINKHFKRLKYFIIIVTIYIR